MGTLHSLETVLGNEKPWIMGIVNVTPDSFSDGGECFDPKKAVKRARDMYASGAAIVDIGGESTGPDAKAVSAAEELERLAPVVQALAGEMPLSIDTYKAEVADFCLKLGARMVNDVSAARADAEMAGVVKRHDAFIVLMHSKEDAAHPAATSKDKKYGDIIAEISEFLRERVAYLMGQGIAGDRIIVDPGLGRFISSDPEYSWEILRRLGELKQRLAPLPVLIGASRKSFLGGLPEDRDPVSQLAALAAWLHGADLLRVHNVEMCRRFLEVWGRVRGIPYGCVD